MQSDRRSPICREGHPRAQKAFVVLRLRTPPPSCQNRRPQPEAAKLTNPVNKNWHAGNAEWHQSGEGFDSGMEGCREGESDDEAQQIARRRRDSCESCVEHSIASRSSSAANRNFSPSPDSRTWSYRTSAGDDSCSRRGTAIRRFSKRRPARTAVDATPTVPRRSARSATTPRRNFPFPQSAIRMPSPSPPHSDAVQLPVRVGSPRIARLRARAFFGSAARRSRASPRASGLPLSAPLLRLPANACSFP